MATNRRDRVARRGQEGRMTRSLRSLVLLAVLGVSLASHRRAAQLPVSLQVDGTEYHAACIRGIGADCTRAFTVVARYDNRTAGPLFLSRCSSAARTPMYAVEVIDDTTDSGYDPVWACVGHDSPIVIAPRTTRVDTLQIEGPHSFDGKTHASIGRLEGDFRLVYRSEAAPARVRPLVFYRSGSGALEFFTWR